MYKLKLHYFVDNYVDLKEKRFFAHAQEEDFLFFANTQTVNYYLQII